MTRMLPRLLLIVAMLTPGVLQALGLGEIRLNSALNQPFDAEIELLAPTSEELQSLKTGLASNDAFERYGIDRPAFLSELRFRVARGSGGRNVIKITSAESITEPFVTLIVEANWAQGRLLREYTVLLDPPSFLPGESTAAPVATPVAGGGGQTQAIERSRMTPSAQPQPAAAYTGGTYRVQRNDTLWRIASGLRPGSPRVVNQTMIAVFRANQEAFDGNINRLRAGSVLRIPDAAELEGISQAEATAEVSRQYREWSGAVSAPAEGGRLRLVAPSEAPSDTGASRTSAAAAQTSTAETEALRQRVQGLETELEETRRLLDLRNAELAEMQRRLAEPVAEVPAEAPVTEAVPEEPEALAEPVGVAPTEEAAEPPVSEPVAPQPEEVAPPVEAPAVPVVRSRPAPEPSFLDRVGQYWWALVVAGLAVLAALLLYVRRRHQPDIEEAIEALAPEELGAAEGTATAPATRRRKKDEDFVVEEQPATATTTEVPALQPSGRAAAGRASQAAGAIGAAAAAAAAKPVARDRVVEDTISSDTAVQLDQSDALAEADFHMAYGLYDQAADLVRIAIEREPERRELKLKLLEIFFVWGNKDSFVETARDLAATRSEAAPGEWDKVLIMGKQICPEEPLFAEEVDVGRAGDLVDLNLEGGESRIDIDLFGEPGGEAGRGLDVDLSEDVDTSLDTAARGDTGIDFLLDEPLRGADEEASPELDASAGTEEVTREVDYGMHTQEVPTLESQTLRERSSQTISEKISFEDFAEEGAATPEQTAELAIDDLGLDVDSVETTGEREIDLSAEFEAAEASSSDLEDTSESRLLDHTEEAGAQEEPSEAWASAPEAGERDTASLRAGDVGFEDTVERPRPDAGSTSVMAPADEELRSLEEDLASTRGTTEQDTRLLDFDVGEPIPEPDGGSSITQGISTGEMELPELEPVTMSEVGTKLDLARAYVDMGDPDGARSILEEVLHEGSVTQREEAQRLLEAIR